MKNKISINKLTLASALLGLLMFSAQMAFADNCDIFETEETCTPIGCDWDYASYSCQQYDGACSGYDNQFDCNSPPHYCEWQTDHCVNNATCSLQGNELDCGNFDPYCDWLPDGAEECIGSFTGTFTGITLDSSQVESIGDNVETTFGQLKTFLVNGAGLWLTIGGALFLIYMLRRWLSMKKGSYRNRL
jgi:hypothetical protein